MAAKNTRTTLLAPIASSARGLELTGLREIVSKRTGEVNYVLCFGNKAEVVMPGSWTIRESEFPEGLYVGIKLDAYWEKDENGIDRFHLSRA